MVYPEFRLEVHKIRKNRLNESPKEYSYICIFYLIYIVYGPIVDEWDLEAINGAARSVKYEKLKYFS